MQKLKVLPECTSLYDYALCIMNYALNKGLVLWNEFCSFGVGIEDKLESASSFD